MFTYRSNGMSPEQREANRRQQRLQVERDIYQSQIQRENIRNLQLQNEALSSSIRAMGGNVPGESRGISTGGSGGTVGGRRIIGSQSQAAERQRAQEDFRNQINLLQAQWQQNQEEKADNFPSLAEIQSLIESSQQKAQEDFTSKIDLLKTQGQQKQEEEQLSARNAAIRMQNYQRQSAIGAWESALRGR